MTSHLGVSVTVHIAVQADELRSGCICVLQKVNMPQINNTAKKDRNTNQQRKVGWVGVGGLNKIGSSTHHSHHSAYLVKVLC